MAKLNFEFDTVSKQATVTMDGAAVGNIGDLCLYRVDRRGDKDIYHLELVQRSQDFQNDTVTYTRTMAHDQAVASLGGESEAGQTLDVADDIRRYFSAE